MNYKEFNDYELLDSIYSVNEDASEILLYKYRPLIVNIASNRIKYCDGGVDLNDLIQEGLLGLSDAINTFNDNKEANFGTYAKICAERRMNSLVKSTKRYKNKLLNESIAFELDDTSMERYVMDKKTNPSYIIEEWERQQELLKRLGEVLTDFEKEVFDLKKNNFDCKEIAEILGKEYKSIDNTIQRIKNKLKKIIESE